MQIVVAGIFSGSVWDFCGIRVSALPGIEQTQQADVLSEAFFGSSLFSVESAMGKAELASHQIEHGDEIDAGAKASRSQIDGFEEFHAQITVLSIGTSNSGRPAPRLVGTGQKSVKVRESF